MAVTEAQTADVAQVLAEILGGVEGLRTSWWLADNSRPPVAILGQPSIDYVDPESPFCFATWDFPVVIVVNRGSGGGERDAQRELSRLVSACALALSNASF
jgi:hypothetical protein